MSTSSQTSESGEFELGQFRFQRDERRQLILIPAGAGLEGYLAFDKEENNFVQVRLLKTQDAGQRASHKSVWTAIRDKNDCSICPEIIAHGEEDGVPYYISTLPAGEPVSHFIKRGGPLPPEVAVKLTTKFLRSLKAQNPVSYEKYIMSPETVWLTRSADEPRLILGDFSAVTGNSAEAKNTHLCLDLLKYLSGNPPFNESFQELISALENGPQTIGFMLSRLESWNEANPAAAHWTDFNQPNPILHQLVPPEVAIQAASTSVDSESTAKAGFERPLWQYIVGIGAAAMAFGLLAVAGLVFFTRGNPEPTSLVDIPKPAAPEVAKVEPVEDEPTLENFPEPQEPEEFFPEPVVEKKEGPPAPEPIEVAKVEVEKWSLKKPLPSLPPVDAEEPEPEAAVVEPVIEPEPEKDLLTQLTEEAEAARSENQLLTSIGKEIDILKLSPESVDGRMRLNKDLTAFQESMDGELTADEVDVIQRASQVNPKAMEILAQHYREAGDWEKEISTLVAMGKAGRPEKLSEAGVRIFQNPDSSEADRSTARQYFFDAAEAGNDEAQFYAGECLVLGRGGEKDLLQGTGYLRKAIATGDARAMDLLGVCYVRAWGVERDDARAVELFQAAIDGGNVPAYYNLGARYAQGQGVERDPEKAADIFAAGSEKGNAHCMLVLARCFETGYGREQNIDKAKFWFSKSAVQGNADAVKWCTDNNVDFEKFLADS